MLPFCGESGPWTWRGQNNAERDPGDDFRLQFEALNELPSEDQALVSVVLEGVLVCTVARRFARPR